MILAEVARFEKTYDDKFRGPHACIHREVTLWGFYEYHCQFQHLTQIMLPASMKINGGSVILLSGCRLRNGSTGTEINIRSDLIQEVGTKSFQ